MLTVILGIYLASIWDGLHYSVSFLIYSNIRIFICRLITKLFHTTQRKKKQNY